MKKSFRHAYNHQRHMSSLFYSHRGYATQSILSLNKASKTYGSKLIIDEATLRLGEGECVVIVGENGIGKSTLLRILMGDIECDAGEYELPLSEDIGYLPQEVKMFSAERDIETISDYLLAHNKMLRRLYQEPVNGTGNAEFNAAGGYRVHKMLKGLRLNHLSLSTPLKYLSGGERNRVALAELLLKEPKLLVLDEPTNHLDKDAKAWLRRYLENYQRSVVMVTHDNGLIRQKGNKILVLNNDHQLEVLIGDYEVYKRKSVEAYQKEQRVLADERKRISKIKHKIDKKNRKQGKTGKKNSRKDIWEIKKFRSELVGAQDAQTQQSVDLKQVDMAFRYEAVNVDEPVITLDEVSKSFDGRSIFKGVTGNLYFDDKVVLLGENGAGKTLLFRMLMKEVTPDTGTVNIHEKAMINYLPQDVDQLDMNASVLEAYAAELNETVPEQKLVGQLKNRCLFEYQMMDIPVRALSIGQMRRLQVAILMNYSSNVLLLDEPTNHMDTFTKSMMIQALQNYQGTVLAISHDDEFLRRLHGTAVWELDSDGLKQDAYQRVAWRHS